MKRIGSGTYSDVYKVGTNHAIKVYRHYQHVGVSSIIEIDTLLKIRHPYLIESDRLLLSDRNAGILMPLADCTLEEYLADNVVGMDALIDILYSMLIATSFLHHHGIIHLDIQAKNILMFDGVAKLADLGMATRLSKDGTILIHREVISRASRPIENIKGSVRYTQKSVVWQLGILALRLLGIQPDNDRVYEWIEQHLSSESRIRRLLDGRDDLIVDLILKMLMKESERYTLNALLKHQIFNGRNVPGGKLLAPPERKEIPKTNEIEKLFFSLRYNVPVPYSVRQLAGKIYRAVESNDITYQVASLFIALKYYEYTIDSPPFIDHFLIQLPVKVTRHECLKAELDILRQLEGRLPLD